MEGDASSYHRRSGELGMRSYLITVGTEVRDVASSLEYYHY